MTRTVLREFEKRFDRKGIFRFNANFKTVYIFLYTVYDNTSYSFRIVHCNDLVFLCRFRLCFVAMQGSLQTEARRGGHDADADMTFSGDDGGSASGLSELAAVDCAYSDSSLCIRNSVDIDHDRRSVGSRRCKL